MHPADAGGDALGLGRDALALARLALDIGDVTDVSEMRCPIEHAMAGLRVLAAVSTTEAVALQDVLDGLADVLVELDSRTG